MVGGQHSEERRARVTKSWNDLTRGTGIKGAIAARRLNAGNIEAEQEKYGVHPGDGPCLGKDPFCPCQDGDPCHYEPFGDTPALLPTRWITKAEAEALYPRGPSTLRVCSFDNDGDGNCGRRFCPTCYPPLPTV